MRSFWRDTVGVLGEYGIASLAIAPWAIVYAALQTIMAGALAPGLRYGLLAGAFVTATFLPKLLRGKHVLAAVPEAAQPPANLGSLLVGNWLPPELPEVSDAAIIIAAHDILAAQNLLQSSLLGISFIDLNVLGRDIIDLSAITSQHTAFVEYVMQAGILPGVHGELAAIAPPPPPARNVSSRVYRLAAS